MVAATPAPAAFGVELEVGDDFDEVPELEEDEVRELEDDV